MSLLQDNCSYAIYFFRQVGKLFYKMINFEVIQGHGVLIVVMLVWNNLKV